MPQVDWYFARGNKQSGPVSSVDLKRLADVGELRPDDLVWREGLSEWVMARNVRGLFDEDASPFPVEPAAAKAAEPSPQAATPESRGAPAAPPAPSRHLFDALLDRLRSAFSDSSVDTMGTFFRACGIYGLLAAMVVGLGFAALVAVSANAPGSIPCAAGLILLLAALQYAAAKACGLLERLNRSISSTLGSSTLPDCVAILSIAAAVSTVLVSIAAVIEGSSFVAIPLGVAGFIVFVYAGIVALRPTSANVSIAGNDQPAPGDEALAVLTFLVKWLARVVPVAFGVGVLCATLALGYAFYQAMAGDEFLPIALMTAVSASYALFYFAALPLVAYLLLLLYGLALDLCRAILGEKVPGTVIDMKGTVC